MEIIETSYAGGIVMTIRGEKDGILYRNAVILSKVGDERENKIIAENLLKEWFENVGTPARPPI